MISDKVWDVQRAAEEWYIGERAVRYLIQRGRVQGAELVICGSRAIWTMPAQPKPEQLKPGKKAK